MSNKAASGLASVQVPETKSFIPGRGEGELTVGGDDDVRNEVVVPVQDFFRKTDGGSIGAPRELPDNDCLVCRGISQ